MLHRACLLAKYCRLKSLWNFKMSGAQIVLSASASARSRKNWAWARAQILRLSASAVKFFERTKALELLQSFEWRKSWLFITERIEDELLSVVFQSKTFIIIGNIGKYKATYMKQIYIFFSMIWGIDFKVGSINREQSVKFLCKLCIIFRNNP